jgi:hypothetical protein
MSQIKSKCDIVKAGERGVQSPESSVEPFRFTTHNSQAWFVPFYLIVESATHDSRLEKGILIFKIKYFRDDMFLLGPLRKPFVLVCTRAMQRIFQLALVQSPDHNPTDMNTFGIRKLHLTFLPLRLIDRRENMQARWLRQRQHR